MSEREIRRLLGKACAELDRCAHSARKAMLPTAIGATLALTGCSGPPKSEAGPDTIKTDKVEMVADAGQTLMVDPDEKPVADAGVPKEPPPPPPPPDWAPDRPYMAPDAVPLHQMLDKSRVA